MIYLAAKNKYFLSFYLLFSKFAKRYSKAYLIKLNPGLYRIYIVNYSSPVERVGFCSWQLYLWPGGNPEKKIICESLLEAIRNQLKKG